MLKDKIASVEQQMRLKLTELRATFAQSGDKGSTAEAALRTFLREYLPHRLEVSHGEVIDTTQNRSKETDVVIVSEDHPFTFTRDLPGLFFVEGVCAAGEVKSILTSDEFDLALKSSLKFKQLKVHELDGTLTCTNPSDEERFYTCPPWFLFAYESQLSLSTIRERAELKAQEVSTPIGLVDGIFVLDRGWAINCGDGQGSFKFGVHGVGSVPGWNSKESDSVLFDFLGWLHAVMPRTVRFQSILVPYLLPAWPRT